jgi:hypothetical protein
VESKPIDASQTKGEKELSKLFASMSFWDPSQHWPPSSCARQTMISH